MKNKDARGWDRVKLILAGLAASGLMFAFMLLLDRFNALAYVLALIILLAWPFVAFRLVRLGGVIVAAYAYGTYILLLAYLVGHALPFQGVTGWLNDAGHSIMGLAVGVVLLGWVSGRFKGTSDELEAPVQVSEA